MVEGKAMANHRDTEARRAEERNAGESIESFHAIEDRRYPCHPWLHE